MNVTNFLKIYENISDNDVKDNNYVRKFSNLTLHKKLVNNGFTSDQSNKMIMAMTIYTLLNI